MIQSPRFFGQSRSLGSAAHSPAQERMASTAMRDTAVARDPRFAVAPIPELAGGHRCLVYFIQCGETGPIKIGFCWTTHLKKRVKDLQLANPYPLVVRATLDGGPLVESRLHQHFAGACIRGEWFEPVPELLALIEEIA